MKRSEIISLLVLCLGTTALAEEIELTGLIDIGGCRLACFRILPNGPTPVLRPGQSADGITLETLDAMSGWAQVSGRAGVIKVWLSSFCASASKPSRPKARAYNFAPGQSSGPWAESSPNSPRVPEPNAEWEQLPQATGGLLQAGLGFPATQLNTVQSNQTLGKTGQADAASQQASGATSQAPDPAAATSPQTGTEQGLNKPARHLLLQTDPSYAEGEQVKLLYGLEAFLAWDLARGQAALEGK